MTRGEKSSGSRPSSLTVDERLFVIRNLEAHEAKAGTANLVNYEVEVFSEVPLSETFESGPYSLRRWDLDPIQAGERRSLVLGLTYCLAGGVDEGISRRDGFYHGLSMQEEFCTLASVVLRKRVWPGPVMRIGNKPSRTKGSTLPRHKALLSGTLHAPTLKESLERIRKLPAKYHEAFILACRMYQEAISIIDEKPDFAYLLLVSAIEVFVAKFGPRTTEDELSPEVRAALDACPEVPRRVLAKRLLELDNRITRNFVSFVVDHVAEDFWARHDVPSAGHVTKAELPKLLKRIYNQRSKTLHEARPFPPYVLFADSEDTEIDRRAEVVVGAHRWTEADSIPDVRFFERVVQHVLLNFLVRRAGETLDETGLKSDPVESSVDPAAPLRPISSQPVAQAVPLSAAPAVEAISVMEAGGDVGFAPKSSASAVPLPTAQPGNTYDAHESRSSWCWSSVYRLFVRRFQNRG